MWYTRRDVASMGLSTVFGFGSLMLNERVKERRPDLPRAEFAALTALPLLNFCGAFCSGYFIGTRLAMVPLAAAAALEGYAVHQIV